MCITSGIVIKIYWPQFQEKVQKFACRIASGRWDASYKELLDLFQLPNVEERRLDLKLGLLFKIVHGLCHFPGIESFTTLQNYYPSRNSHCLQLNVPFAHTNWYKYSFFPQIYYIGILQIQIVYFLVLIHLLCIIYLNYVLPRAVQLSVSLYPSGHAPDQHNTIAIVCPLHNMHKVLQRKQRLLK